MPETLNAIRSDQANSEAVDARPVHTSCAHCGASSNGRFGAGRAWFVDHRATAHPQLEPPPERPRRRSAAGWR
jgi:hypothetical protein